MLSDLKRLLKLLLPPILLKSIKGNRGHKTFEGIYEKFSEGFAKEAGNIQTGQGFDPTADQGPLIDEAALAKVEEHVADAKNHGGEVILGGHPHKLGGLFYDIYGSYDIVWWVGIGVGAFSAIIHLPVKLNLR